MVLEECAELILAIQHHRRNRNSLEAVAEEIADVEIMCGQLRLMVGNELVDKQKVAKLKRLSKRLDKEAPLKQDVAEMLGCDEEAQSWHNQHP
jgi:NTP pyrophosphatase (non-canonical NTP hydrolase)